MLCLITLILYFSLSVLASPLDKQAHKRKICNKMNQHQFSITQHTASFTTHSPRASGTVRDDEVSSKQAKVSTSSGDDANLMAVAKTVTDIVKVTITHHAIQTNANVKSPASHVRPSSTKADLIKSKAEVQGAQLHQASNKPAAAPTIKTTSTEIPASNSDNQAWLDAHNSYRAQYGAPPVVWFDDALAQAVANVQQSVMNHTKDGERQYGENLFSGPGEALSPAKTVKGWMDESSELLLPNS